MPIISKSTRAAMSHLSKNDAVLAILIKRFGPFDIKPHQNYYKELVNSIISQQLSVKAAYTIQTRFVNLFGDSNVFPTPEDILKKSPEDIRSAGLSTSKINYIRDLAEHIIDGRLKLYHLINLPNESVIEELIAVKGIGEWTAHMFLIFSIGRLDVLPTGDLGIKNGVKALYNLPGKPTASDIVKISEINNWHPYESVACWYIWKSLDNE